MNQNANINSRDIKRSVRRRKRARLAVGVNVLVALLLASLLVGMLNYLSYRHYYRADLSRSKYYELSDKTRSLLDSLPGDVKVIVFFQRQQPIFEDVENLIKEYEYASKKVRVEYVDPDRDIGRTEELARKYEVTQPNVIVFDKGERSKYITADDIYEYDYQSAQLGLGPGAITFKGEQVFSSAIQEITQGEKPIVYFLGGHGERGIEDFDPHTGYSTIARLLRRDNLELKSLLLGEALEIPEDCDALVIAGPAKRLSQPEIDLVETYLENQGRIMVLVDALTQSGLEPLLEIWRVVLAKDLVVDATRTLTGQELFLTEYGSHPITEKLHGISSVFYLPRSVVPMLSREEEAQDNADRPRVVSLAACSESGWAESNIDQNPMRFDPGKDRPGPVSVAVAIEKGPGPGLKVEIRPTRLVVFGDSDFVSNRALTGGDVDFFMSALNWLLEREELMAIVPKEIEQMQLTLDGRDLLVLFWAVVAGLPGFVGVLGVMVWWFRRS